jgi:hypothetical protein
VNFSREKHILQASLGGFCTKSEGYGTRLHRLFLDCGDLTGIVYLFVLSGMNIRRSDICMQ